MRSLSLILVLCAGGLWAGITYLPNRLERVMVVFDLEKHREGLGLQQWVSKLAFGSGGVGAAAWARG